ncbi:hypothetical protein GCM10009122_56080 [Fulvivirga kasyanovii]|uniref:Glycosyltransferase n=1 Tax=Fulvivirga kasyanovii TaxID=396812 RepID=A0ABW9RKK9_9BACT|nr:glycosyltransferase family 4 protein [Fulvivirga kasyanovii]MTI24632.1 glycosyltransferase [Fulvivirga kasyanovii]
MSNRIKVACLPRAGIENPYQYLMIKGLQEDDRLHVYNGEEGKLFAFLLTWLKSRPDYIHLDWLHQYYLRKSLWMTWVQFPIFIFEVLFLKYLLRVKFVWTLHNIYPHDQPYFGPYKWARRFFAKKCKWIRVFSESTVVEASAVLGVHKSKLSVIPEGSYVEYYPNTSSKEDSLAYLNLKITDRVLLFLGNIRKYKGLEHLITVFKVVKRENWKLVIAGMCRDQVYKNELHRLIETDQDIVFVPQLIPVDEVQYFMNSAEAVVLPFQKIENSGSVILAMGFGKAIVAPAMGAVVDRLKSQNQLLYNPEGEEELRAIIRRLMEMDHEEVNDYGRINAEELKEYQWKDFSKMFN